MKRALSVILTVLIAMQLLAAGTALADYDPIIVQVGNYAYPRSQAIAALELSAAYYKAATGYEATGDVLEELKASVITSFINQGVLQNKAHELGLDVMTTDDNKRALQITKEKMEQYTEEYTKAIRAKYDCDAELAARAAPIFMELDGITVTKLHEQAEAQVLQDKLTAYLTKDVPRLTESEVLAWYQTNYVTPYRERYANDLALFEQEVVLGGGTSFYVPEGYRYVQNIVFSPTEAEVEQAYLLHQRLYAAEEEVERLDNALYGYRLLGEDDTQAAADLEAGKAAAAAIQAEIDTLYAQMAAPFMAQIEEVKARLDAGEDFMTLRSEFDANPEPQDKGYLVHAASTAWEDAFHDAAMALEKPGDWTGPILTGGGAQFLLYVEDAPQGQYPMELAGVEEITEAAQAYADNELLVSYAALWKNDYPIETHPELLIIR